MFKVDKGFDFGAGRFKGDLPIVSGSNGLGLTGKVSTLEVGVKDA